MRCASNCGSGAFTGSFAGGRSHSGDLQVEIPDSRRQIPDSSFDALETGLTSTHMLLLITTALARNIGTVSILVFHPSGVDILGCGGKVFK